MINALVHSVGPYEASRMLAAMIREQWEAADEHDADRVRLIDLSGE